MRSIQHSSKVILNLKLGTNTRCQQRQCKVVGFLSEIGFGLISTDQEIKEQIKNK